MTNQTDEGKIPGIIRQIEKTAISFTSVEREKVSILTTPKNHPRPGFRIVRFWQGRDAIETEKWSHSFTLDYLDPAQAERDAILWAQSSGLVEINKNTRLEDDFEVIIGDHVYEMGSRADQPNGLCIYLGVMGPMRTVSLTPIGDVSRGIHRQILNILRFDSEGG